MNQEPEDVVLENKGEAGQGLAEYALILTLIAAVCVGALAALGGSITAGLGGVTGSL